MDMTQTIAADEGDVVEKREVADRRRLTWRSGVHGFLRSRRRELRRAADSDVLFLDRRHPWLFFLATGIMLLSSVDAFMTLQLLERGMVEANPVMAAVMTQSTMTFAASKMFMTGTGILALVYLAEARFMDRFRTGVLLTICFSGYACLICYEIVNLLYLL